MSDTQKPKQSMIDRVKNWMEQRNVDKEAAGRHEQWLLTNADRDLTTTGFDAPGIRDNVPDDPARATSGGEGAKAKEPEATLDVTKDTRDGDEYDDPEL